MQDFWQVWAKNQAHSRVVSLLQHGYRLDFKILPKLSKIPLILSKYDNKNKDGALHEAVQAMLAKKAITHVRKLSTLGYYSRLFLVPKPMKRLRPVIDLSMLNTHLHVPTFKMETAESIRLCLLPSSHPATSNSKNNNIPMQDDSTGSRVARDAMVLGSGGSLDQGNPTAPSLEDTTETATL